MMDDLEKAQYAAQILAKHKYQDYPGWIVVVRTKYVYGRSLNDLVTQTIVITPGTLPRYSPHEAYLIAQDLEKG